MGYNVSFGRYNNNNNNKKAPLVCIPTVDSVRSNNSSFGNSLKKIIKAEAH